MKNLIILLVFLSGFTLNSCNNSSNSHERPKTPEDLRAELKTQELANPLQYLSDKSVTLTPLQKKVKEGGLFRDPEYAPDGAKVEGTIVNTATLAKYKDVEVRISFYSKTETLISDKNYVIYNFYPANSSTPFSIKIDNIPQAYDSFGFEVTGAMPVEED